MTNWREFLKCAVTPEKTIANTAGRPGTQQLRRDLKATAGAKVEMTGVPGALKTCCKKGVLTITTPDPGPDQFSGIVFKINGADVLPET